MTPQRIQRSRAKDWKLPADTVVVTRPGKWGNPFAVEETAGGWLLKVEGKAANDAKVMDIARKWNEIGALGHRAASVVVAVEAFRQLHDNEISRHAIRHALKGRVLACWCSVGTPCHADVLLAIANDEASTTYSHADGQTTDGNPRLSRTGAAPPAESRAELLAAWEAAGQILKPCANLRTGPETGREWLARAIPHPFDLERPAGRATPWPWN